jgi:dTDP-4-dehydrorhamnose 3,5-epimerase
MVIIETYFSKVKLIHPTIYKDDRGFFLESFNSKLQNEIKSKFLQDNHSKSKQGVLRGLHYQWDKPMGKLLRVINGSGFSVVVDIRKNSSNYGEWVKISLDDIDNNILWVPPGFAHGFLALENNTHLCYKTTSLHNSNSEGAIHPLNSGLNIDWGVDEEKIILSEKDSTAQSFEDYNKNPKFK